MAFIKRMREETDGQRQRENPLREDEVEAERVITEITENWQNQKSKFILGLLGILRHWKTTDQ